ncbi:MAG: ATP-binding cassette domain-containing protein [Acetobacteraceae bacterium]|jgi:ABC-type iron transport system FetAB ATPase subunit|nr:ATP-binding cassette domain-containing protein [Acetobacteraceae bacterium]
MDTHLPVLAFSDARIAIDPDGGTTAPITLTLAPGGFAVADLRGPRQCIRLADAVTGLLPPRSGAVLFQGRDWREVTPEHAAAMRGRIGRHFARDAWLPEIGIEENILLAPLFHTKRPLRAVRDEAARLAAGFGMPGLPMGNPASLSPADRHRAGLVRAFLNSPDLVVLEEPTAVDGEALMPALMAAIREVRDRAGAVLWLTAGLPPAFERRLPATERFRLSNGALIDLGARAA